ncbi:MAG: alanine racemase [Actinobacteria bacterium]|nr:alanine racemase [Actinomycetota bacterium]
MFKNYFRPTWVEVDLSKIRSNVSFLKSKVAQNTQLMAVVKADAYGHGAIPVARACIEAGAERLGVATVEEAIELREGGLVCLLHLLSEPPDGCEDELLRYKIIPVIYTLEAAKRISDYFVLEDRTCDAMIKIDTGMNRVGISVERCETICEKIFELQGLNVIGVMTHFAAANSDPEFTAFQLQKFQSAIFKLRSHGFDLKLSSAANSAAILRMPDSHLDMVRAGIAIYGLSPFKGSSVSSLKPALTWKTRISFIKNLGTGEPVSYGMTFRTQQPSVIATLPVGYADGYGRVFSNKASVIVNNCKVRIVGTVTMDQIMVDVSNVMAPKIGDEVLLIGESGDLSVSADELAELSGTINYEIVTRIGKRVPRIYVD